MWSPPTPPPKNQKNPLPPIGIGIWSPNNAEWVVTQFATAKAGLILVNINPAYRTHELEYALNKVGCRAWSRRPASRPATTSACCASWRRSRPQRQTGHLDCTAATLEHLIRGGRGAPPAPSDEIRRGPAPPRATRRLERLAGELQFDDPINIQFTSGTTGAPKGATLTHHNILNNGFFIGEACGSPPEDKVCIPVPLYHCFGMVLGNLACVTHGAAMVDPGRRLRPAGGAARPSTRSAAPRSTACRPCSSPSSITPSSPRFDLTSPAHRHHGGLALPDRGHAPGRGRDAHGAR